MKLRYANESHTIEVSKVYEWDHADLPALDMSTSSGPKDSLRNQAYVALNAHPSFVRVVMVRGCGSPFFLMQDANGRWFDVAGKQVVPEKS